MIPSYATTSRWVSLLLLSLFTLRTTAIQCNIEGTIGKNPNSVLLSNQNDIDTKLKDCTEILGTIFISRNFTGAFYLPNVTFVRDTFATFDPDPNYINPSLTSIEAPDLIRVGGIYLYNSPSLVTVSFPKLSGIAEIVLNEIEAASVDFSSLERLDDEPGRYGSVNVIGTVSSLNFPLLKSVSDFKIFSYEGLKSDRENYHTSPIDINLPALRNVSYISFLGNISSLSLPQLSTVRHDLRIETYGNPVDVSLPVLRNTSTLYLAGFFSSLSLPQLYTVREDLQIETHGNPVDVSFPVLRNTSTLYLSGNFSSLSLPQLSSVDKNLDIETYGNPIDVSLPILSKVRRVKIAGTIKSTSFPLLLTTSTFDLHCVTPMNVTLAPLQTITETLNLSGNITSYSLDSIMMIDDHYYGGVDIDSDLPLDCDPAIAAWERSGHTRTDWNFKCGDTDFDQLRDDKKEAKRRFDHRWRMGVGIGLGVAAVIGIAVAIWVVHKRVARKMQAMETSLPPPKYELGDLPKYEPRAEDGASEQGSEAAINTHQGNREGNAREEEASGRVVPHA